MNHDELYDGPSTLLADLRSDSSATAGSAAPSYSQGRGTPLKHQRGFHLRMRSGSEELLPADLSGVAEKPFIDVEAYIAGLDMFKETLDTVALLSVFVCGTAAGLLSTFSDGLDSGTHRGVGLTAIALMVAAVLLSIGVTGTA